MEKCTTTRIKDGTKNATSVVNILIGANFANKILLEKRTTETCGSPITRLTLHKTEMELQKWIKARLGYLRCGTGGREIGESGNRYKY